jgi:hypothetical protein
MAAAKLMLDQNHLSISICLGTVMKSRKKHTISINIFPPADQGSIIITTRLQQLTELGTFS